MGSAASRDKSEPVNIAMMAFFSDDGYYINGAIKGTYTVKMDQLVDKLTAYGFDPASAVNKKDVSLPAPMWDVGGRSGIFKPLLRHYVANANAWVIAVDCSTEPPHELKRTLSHLSSYNIQVPLLILAHNTEAPGAMSVEDLTHQLDLATTMKERPYRVTAANVQDKTDEDFRNGLQWVVDTLRGGSDATKAESEKKTTSETLTTVKKLAASVSAAIAPPVPEITQSPTPAVAA